MYNKQARTRGRLICRSHDEDVDEESLHLNPGRVPAVLYSGIRSRSIVGHDVTIGMDLMLLLMHPSVFSSHALSKQVFKRQRVTSPQISVKSTRMGGGKEQRQGGSSC
jgi:hypothetical protein